MVSVRQRHLTRLRQTVRPAAVAALLAAGLAGAGCARGPVVAREVLADPAMHFAPADPIAAPGARTRIRPDPLPPDTVALRTRVQSEPGADVRGSWIDSSLRAAVELLAGIGLEAGYGLALESERVQKLDGFTGPLELERTRHGPDAALVFDDGTSLLRAGYRYRTAWDGVLHEPSVYARTSVLRRDTVVEVGYRRSMRTVNVPASRLPARDPVDAEAHADRFHAAIEQGLLPGWNLRLEASALVEEGMLHSPHRLVSLWAWRDPAGSPQGGVPRTEPEHHPGSRIRWGAMFRVRRALTAIAAVVELGAGYGGGTWRVAHAAAGARYIQRLGDAFLLELGGGAYHQTRASFYRDDYIEGPPGSYWSADRLLSSYLAYWGEAALRWTCLPERGRLLGMFKYLTLGAAFRYVQDDYRWEGAASLNGFTSHPDLASPARTAFAGGMHLGGWLEFEGGF